MLWNKLAIHASSFLGWLMMLLLLSNLVEAQTMQGGSGQCIPQAGSDSLSSYVGRFKMSDGSVLIVEEQAGELTLRPIFWRAVQLLHRVRGDVFGIEEREDRQVTFIRDAKGCIVAVKIIGFGDDGTFPRLGAQRTPIELLMMGHPQEAAERMVKIKPNGVGEFVNIARTLLQKFPSRASDAIRFLTILVKHYPRGAMVHAVLGDAYIVSGQRKLAVGSYLAAYKLDAMNNAALRGLRRLRAMPLPSSANHNGWSLPFSLEEVFAKPTKDEIRAVENDWAKRDLSPRDVAVVTTGKLNLGETEAVVHIISHRVHGQKHYGAIIMPEGTEIGTHPVVLDLKGVSWDYFPLDLNRLLSPKFLGVEQKRFIFVVPSFRGEVLRFNSAEYLSEGDRTDSWDGATDDALSLLNVALSITPQADPRRVCAFGKSRGGSLALLAGIRNPYIKLVLEWAGPVDWFDLMATEGWTQQEIVADALLNRATPREDGGQFIERFLAKAIAGKQTLHEVRLRMLASSPLYFAGHLPQAQIHYGVEDEMVPVINGKALAQLMKRKRRNSQTFAAFFHANAGHDLTQKLAYSQSRNFYTSLFSVK